LCGKRQVFVDRCGDKAVNPVQNEGDDDSLVSVKNVNTDLVEGAQTTPELLFRPYNNLNLGQNLYCIYVDFQLINLKTYQS
jgi:hypothetical protein